MTDRKSRGQEGKISADFLNGGENEKKITPQRKLRELSL
jgi:hypothetical protein